MAKRGRPRKTAARKKPAAKRKTTAKKKVVYKTRYKKRRGIAEKMSTQLTDVAMLAAGAVAAGFAAKALSKPLAKMTEKLPMADKINYSGVAVAVIGTFLSTKAKKQNKLITLGMAAGGVITAVEPLINKEAPVSSDFTDEVEAELLAVNGVQRIADYNLYGQEQPMYGVQRIADDMDVIPNNYDFRTF